MNMPDANWGTPPKIKARQETIILPYQEHFGTFPINAEYWTMCGRCATNEKTLVQGCELDYLSQIGFITPSQFHGVEIDPITHQNNSCIPDAHFYQGMLQFHIQKAKNPAIVNFDHHLSVEQIRSQLICLLNNLQPYSNFMLVINLLKKYRAANDTEEHILKKLTTIDQMIGYNPIKIYKYKGAHDNENTRMVSVVLKKVS